MELTDNDLPKYLEESTGFIIVDFWSPTCGPCKMLNPVMEKVSQDEVVLKVDITQNPYSAQYFKINAVPTLIFFQDGKIVETKLGYHSESQLREIIGRLKNG
jgi:thioredoxin